MNLLPYLWLVPVLPLSGGAIMFIFGRAIDSDPERPSRIPGILCSVLVAVSFLIACVCAWNLQQLPHREFEIRGVPWFAGGEWGFFLDPLSLVLMLLVSGIGLLVHIYSNAYMRDDGGQYRFFGGLSFFVAMMQVLVLANNYLLLFAGWEGVGFASYLLIGFYYKRWNAGLAGMKAFVINRAADAVLLLALMYMVMQCGSTEFHAVMASTLGWRPVHFALVASLMLVGALGKSAQFPLHIWLPDAMEGPTPVSALIHSATMVCAGVYLIARSNFIFLHAPEVNVVAAVIGTFTALLAASIALVENDIKRVLAYSTISQIGFMFIALGMGAYQIALFHLFTHAFFKSLLFLGSGSIIHALHGEQNLKHMGGLREKLPVTFGTMLVGALTLAAVPGLAGFFSKDAILGETLHLRNGWLFLTAGLVTSLLTACYAWRLICLVFYGEESQVRENVHESPSLMTLPMVLLAAACVIAGYVFMPIRWSEWPLMLVSAVIAFAGMGITWRYYIVHPSERLPLDRRFARLVNFLRNRWYIDALYEEKILNVFILGAAGAASVFDRLGIDGVVHAASWLIRRLSRVSRWLDRWVVDGMVRFTSGGVRLLSTPARALQTGFVQTYAFFFVAGILVALGYYLTH